MRNKHRFWNRYSRRLRKRSHVSLGKERRNSSGSLTNSIFLPIATASIFSIPVSLCILLKVCLVHLLTSARVILTATAQASKS